MSRGWNSRLIAGSQCFFHIPIGNEIRTLRTKNSRPDGVVGYHM